MVGNTLSLLVFCTRRMRRSAYSVFLAALAAADNTFLLGLLATLVNESMYAILTTNVSCRLLIFTTYVASFLSVWFIVGFTCERYIAIKFPLKRSFICSVTREKVVVMILTTFACLMYIFSFWTTVAMPFGNEIHCTYNVEYFNVLKVATWMDTCITILIPFLSIMGLNSLLVQSIMVNNKKTAKYGQARSGDRKAALPPSFRDAGHRMDTDWRIDCIRRTSRRILRNKKPQGRVTRTLLSVSLTFIFLNLPSHVLRLYSLICTEMKQYEMVSVEFLFFQELSQMLFYATFGCNFFIYTLYGKNFKRSLLILLRCKSTIHEERKRLLKQFSLMDTSNTAPLRSGEHRIASNGL
ncbi:hypothetical protein DPMN_188414 [Dreissena polymorpha]|uniref:G-protein coupled receptors family 1 profile domain-containing protein n=1 Tax=Dreissena polymorpha TaxID=45954 RepID=A0A9D4DSD5_DREPO|nr:hypothetical protein DPMN_188414 [Dreissena polymorpha]